MSFWELMVVLLVAVLVIHPKRLPEMAYLLGRILHRTQQWYYLTLQKFNSPP